MFYFLIGISIAFCSAADQKPNSKLMDAHVHNFVTTPNTTFNFIDTEDPKIAAQHDGKDARFSQLAKIPFIKTEKPINFKPFGTKK